MAQDKQMQNSIAALERYRIRAGALFTVVRDKFTALRRQLKMDSRYRELVVETAPDVHDKVLAKMEQEGRLIPRKVKKAQDSKPKPTKSRQEKKEFAPSYKTRELTQQDLEVIKGLYDRKHSFIKACGMGDKSQHLGPTHAYVTSTVPITMHRWKGHCACPEFIDDIVPAGSTLKIVMISRFQDVGLTDDMSAENGYHVRVPLDSADIKDYRWQP